MKNRKIVIGLVSFFILLGAFFSFYYYKVIKEKRNPSLAYYSPDKGSSVRPFKFVNQDGDTITEQDVKGKILVVKFFFATCKGICPTMNEEMKRVYDAFRTNDNVLFLSHTVDPERDSVAALKIHSLKYNADPKKCMFLTGNKQDLYYHAMHSFLLGVKENEGLPLEEQFIHSPDIVLVDKYGRLRAHPTPDGRHERYNGTDSKSMKTLIKDINILLKEDGNK